MEERFAVAVFFGNAREHGLALEALRKVDPGAIQEFAQVLEGILTAPLVRELRAAGLSVQRLHDTPASSKTAFRRSKRHDPETRARIERFAAMAPSETTEEQVYQVRLRGPMRQGWADELVEAGAHVCGCNPPDVYRMFLSIRAAERVRALPFVHDVRLYDAIDTVTHELLDEIGGAAPEASLASADAPEERVFDLVLHRERDRDEVRRFLTQAGARVRDAAGVLVRFVAPSDASVLARIVEHPMVKSVAPYRAPQLFAYRAQRLVGADRLASAFTGSGELVAVFDSGIDETHPDFDGRLECVEAVSGAIVDDRVGHGTHVAGIIAGNGACSAGKIRGIAHGAKLCVFGIVSADGRLQIPLDLGELLKLALDRGAKIVNLSWGTPLSGSYDHGSSSVDAFVHANPEMLVVVAAGNEGTAVGGEHRFATIGTPATAKNALTVGACGTDREEIRETWGERRPDRFSDPLASEERVSGEWAASHPSACSGRGPTDYDAIKPDLLAPGTYVASVRAADASAARFPVYPDHDGRYAYSTGTSMAAPVVSAAAALVREHLRVARGADRPSAALLKAILISATRPVAKVQRRRKELDVGYPDFDQGFGRLDLALLAENAFAFVDVPNDGDEALAARAARGSKHVAIATYHTTLALEGELSVVLAWTDRPGNAVQNNLQLEVRTPDDRTLVGNADHRYRKDAAFDDASFDGVVYDKRNNVERVRLEQAPPGEYRVRVLAQNTPFPPQGYALCVRGALVDPRLVKEE